jgi:hypothetical protein
MEKHMENLTIWVIAYGKYGKTSAITHMLHGAGIFTYKTG